MLEASGKFDDWCNDNLKWIKETFGSDNLFSAVLRMDATMPGFFCKKTAKIFCSLKNNLQLCTMKKEFGKWLMDIAKYIVTAIILSSFFNTMEEKRTIYILAVIIAVIIVLLGLYLQKEPPAKKKRR
jgi:uncharacterized membrane protein